MGMGSAVDQRHRHVVDIGARGAGAQQAAARLQGVVGVVVLQYVKDAHALPGQRIPGLPGDKAAGGFVTGQTRDTLARQGVRIFDVLKDNDAYHALEACGGLLRTGATGTNVNDVAVALIHR